MPMIAYDPVEPGMKLIPPEISLRNPSAAEKKVFRLLKLVEVEGCFALHSLNLSEHEYKVCGEIDFLIVGPPGFFVLEVKGGRIARKDGVWGFTDRYGHERRKAEGPFDQAQSAAFALLKRLKVLLAAGSLPRLVFGWAVVFPDQEFGERSVEWAPEMVLDEDDCRTAAALESGLRRLIRYWTAKSEGARRLHPEEVARLRGVLRPDFELAPSLRLRGEQLDLDHQSLTEAQYKALDLVEENERILCAGGAGTGKTFLAAEVARRESAAGRKVLVTCKSSILARFLAEQPGLAAGNCATLDLPRASSRADRYDCVVIDEAQDVMNADDLAVVDGLLNGGLEAGRWRMFYDPNNQTGILGEFDPVAFVLLAETGPARIKLPDNCRNTRDIVTQVQLVTGADVGVSTAGAGVPVEYEFWTTDQEQSEKLAAHLMQLLEDGVEPQHVTVLSPVRFQESCVRLLPDRLRTKLRALDAQSVVRPVSGIGFAAVRDFKGLENRFVCVVDLRHLDDTVEALNTLYVAMTRPRAGLWLAVHHDFQERLYASRRKASTDQERK
jgi:Nuclease-related domain/AAA domain